jgi:hypothetical protein
MPMKVGFGNLASRSSLRPVLSIMFGSCIAPSCPTFLVTLPSKAWSFALRRETLTSNTASKFTASLASSYLALKMGHLRLYDSLCRVARSKEPSLVPP